jgi:hypothetical protein
MLTRSSNGRAVSFHSAGGNSQVSAICLPSSSSSRVGGRMLR